MANDIEGFFKMLIGPPKEYFGEIYYGAKDEEETTELKEVIKEILMEHIPMIDLSFDVDEDAVDKVVELIMKAVGK